LVTNGADWLLVAARPGEPATYVTWDAALWSEEPLTLRAFSSLVGAMRLFGVAERDRLPALLAESAQNQQEVTDQLGLQVRKAVEVLVQAVDRINIDRSGQLLATSVPAPSGLGSPATTLRMSATWDGSGRSRPKFTPVRWKPASLAPTSWPSQSPTVTR
jgi:hypothetical protein